MNVNESNEKKSIGAMAAGEEGIITKIRGAAALHRYLFGLGIVAGTIIRRGKNHGEVISGNPIPFRVRNKVVYLSDEIARCIQVAVCGKEPSRSFTETARKTGPERVYYPWNSYRPAVNPVNS